MNLKSNGIESGNCYSYKLPNEKLLGIIIYSSENLKKDKSIKAIVVSFGELKTSLSVNDFVNDGWVYKNSIFNPTTETLTDGLFMLDLNEDDSEFTSQFIFVGKMIVDTATFRYGSGISGANIAMLNTYLSSLDNPIHKHTKAPLKKYIAD